MLIDGAITGLARYPSTAARNTVQPLQDVVNVTLKSKASQTANHIEGRSSANVVQWFISAVGAAFFLGTIGLGTAPTGATGLSMAYPQGSLTGAAQIGISLNNTFSSSATTSITSIRIFPQTQAATYTTTDLYGIHILGVTKGAGHTITTAYGIKIDDITISSNSYAIYSGAGLVRFGGAATLASTLNVTGTVTLATLAGTGTRLVTASSTGVLGFSAGSAIDGAGAATQIAYWTDADTLAGSANLTWSGTLVTVTGAASISSTLQVGGSATVSGSLSVTGAGSIGSTLSVSGNAGFGGAGTSASQVIRVNNTALTGTAQYGIVSNSSFTSAATTSGVAGYFGASYGAGAAATFSAGVQIDTGSKASGTITTSYGLLIENQSIGTTAYSIFTKTGLVHFGGAVDMAGTLTVVDTITGNDRIISLRVASNFAGTNGAFLASSTLPTLTFTKTNAATDEKNWVFYTGATQFDLVTGSDTGASKDVFWRATRTGTTPTNFQIFSNTAVSGTFSAGNSSFANANVTGNLFVDGTSTFVMAVTMQSTLAVSGIVSFTNTTEATGPAAASVKLAGGLGIAKGLWSSSWILTDMVLKNSFVINSSGSNYGFISNTAANTWALGYGLTITTLGTSALTWNSSGAIGIPGVLSITGTLTVFGAAGFGANPNAAIGVYVSPSTLTGTGQYGMQVEPFASAGATGLTGIYTSIRTSTAIALANAYGVRIDQTGLGGGGTVSNLYGLKIENQSTGSTASYAIHTSAGLVHFGGAVDMSSTLTVTGNLFVSSGSTQFRTGTTGINVVSTDRGIIMLGASGGFQLQMDADEIQGMNGGTPSQIDINWGGGTVAFHRGTVGAAVTMGGTLSVLSTATVQGGTLTLQAANSLSEQDLVIKSSRGSVTSPSNVVNGDGTFALIQTVYSGSGYYSTAQINFVVDGTFTSGQRPPSKMDFYTNQANTAQTLAMRIEGNQRITLTGLSGSAALSVVQTSNTGVLSRVTAFAVTANQVTFTTAGSDLNAGTIIESTLPYVAFHETGVAANQGWWAVGAQASRFRLVAFNDVGGAINDILTVDRSGAAATLIRLVVNVETIEKLTTAASTTTRAGLRIQPGADPTTPVDGDMWYDTGTNNIRVRLNGVNRRLMDLPA